MTFGLPRGPAAGPLPRRPGRARPALRDGRRAPAGLPGRRRAVAGPRVGAGAVVRRPPAAGRFGAAGVRRPGARRRVPRAARARRRGPAGRRRPRAAATRSSAGRWTSGCASSSSPRPAGNPLALLELPRELTARAVGRRLRAARRRPCRTGSRRASGGGSRCCRKGPGGCCSSRRPTRSVTPPCCGGRPGGSGSPAGRRAGGRGRPARDRRAGGFRHPLCARRCTGRPRPRTGGPRTARWPRPPTRSSIRTAGPGTRPTPPRTPTRRWPPSWSARRAGRRPAAGSRRWPRSWPGRPRSRPTRPAGRTGRWPPPRPRYAAGASDTALMLLATAEAGPLEELAAGPRRPAAGPDRAASSTAATRRRRCCCGRQAAASRSTLDLARATYLDAINAAMFASRLASPAALRRRVAGGPAAPPGPRIRRRATTFCWTGSPSCSPRATRRGLPTLRRARPRAGVRAPSAEQFHWLWLGLHRRAHSWDDDSWDVLSGRHVRSARDAGALGELPLPSACADPTVLSPGTCPRPSPGRGGGGGRSRRPAATWRRSARSGWPRCAAARTRRPGRRADRPRRVRELRDEGVGLGVAACATAVLNNGLGRYDRALVAAERASEHPDELGASTGCCRADRGRGPERRRSWPPTPLRRLAETHHGERQRLGARDRGALAARW